MLPKSVLRVRCQDADLLSALPGKSTLALALLRLIPTEGKVYIDGIATSTLNLDALRSKITIIPQDPTLSVGPLSCRGIRADLLPSLT